MEAKEEIYQYIRKNIKEDGVTAQSIAEIFGIKRNVASHYLNLLEKEGKLQKGTNLAGTFFNSDRYRKESGRV